MYSKFRRLARRLLGGRASVPEVHGVANAGWYDAVYRDSDSYAFPYWQSPYYFLWTVLADRIRTSRLRRVLDIGCGPGQLASCLFDLAAITEYTGIDFSTQAIAMAKRVCPQGRFVVADATITSVHEEIPYDVVVCAEFLEHVPEDYDAIARFRPGVRCLCTVPNFPYESHVRHFVSATQVIERYGPLFASLDVWPLRGDDKRVYFVMDGVRNGNREALTAPRHAGLAVL